MTAETSGVDGVRLLCECMEMNLHDASSQTPPSLRLWCVISQTLRLVFHYSWYTGERGRRGGYRGDRVGRRRRQSLSWVAEHSVTYLMSFMHVRYLLCVLRRRLIISFIMHGFTFSQGWKWLCRKFSGPHPYLGRQTMVDPCGKKREKKRKRGKKVKWAS